MTLKPYQQTQVRRQVRSALLKADIKEGCGSSYKNAALKVVIGLHLSGPEYDYARSVVTEWLG